MGTTADDERSAELPISTREVEDSTVQSPCPLMSMALHCPLLDFCILRFPPCVLLSYIAPSCTSWWREPLGSIRWIGRAGDLACPITDVPSYAFNDISRAIKISKHQASGGQ